MSKKYQIKGVVHEQKSCIRCLMGKVCFNHPKAGDPDYTETNSAAGLKFPRKNMTVDLSYQTAINLEKKAEKDEKDMEAKEQFKKQAKKAGTLTATDNNVLLSHNILNGKSSEPKLKEAGDSSLRNMDK